LNNQPKVNSSGPGRQYQFGRQETFPFAGTDIIMFSTAKEDEKRAAWEFMKYLISPEVTAYWAVNTGYLPVRRSALQTTIWKQAAKADPLIEIPLQQIDKRKNGSTTFCLDRNQKRCKHNV